MTNAPAQKTAQSAIEAPVMETPCVKICVINESTGLCSGCGRSRHEIGGWTSFTNAERRRIMAELPERLDKLIKT
jgi:uncharacterized protein